jgi:hypothetical protein
MGRYLRRSGELIMGSMTNLIDAIIDMRSEAIDQQEIVIYNEILDFIEGKI